MALTNAAIRATKPAKKPFKMYDREGLFLVVNPGGSKLWRWRYWANGKEKLMALGEYPIVSLAEARERHFAARKKVAAGIDPIMERKAEAESRKRDAEARQREAENSFEKIARKWWEWWSAGKSPRHTDYVLRRLEADVFPAFGHKFIDNVTPADIRQLMLAVEGRGARDVAKRAHDKNKPMSNNTILFALYRLGYKGRMTGHGFRGLASTILHENDFADEHIELQLAHLKRNKVAAAYNHAKYLTQRASMMQWWADYLDAQLAKGEESQGGARWKRAAVQAQQAGMKRRGSVKPQIATHGRALRPTA